MHISVSPKAYTERTSVRCIVYSRVMMLQGPVFENKNKMKILYNIVGFMNTGTYNDRFLFFIDSKELYVSLLLFG